MNLKDQLEQLHTDCSKLIEDQPEHTPELEDIQRQVLAAVVDVCEPEGRIWARNLIERTRIRLAAIMKDAAPPTLRSAEMAVFMDGYEDTDEIPPPDSYVRDTVPESGVRTDTWPSRA